MLKRMILSTLTIFLFISCGSGLKYSVHDVLPFKGYIFVKKIVEIHLCKKKKCQHDRLTAYGSGFVVKTTYKGSYVMTAAHVCTTRKPPVNYQIKVKMKVQTRGGRYFNAQVLDFNKEVDVCIMFVEDMINGIEAVTISSRAPKAGDKVFNIASPYGIHDIDMTPIFEGRYVGEDIYDAMYTFPAAGGSSGSMILNEKGELIGLLHSVYIRMNTIVLSARYDDLKQFIQKSLIENAQEKHYGGSFTTNKL